jgi:hypothetical protein
MPHEHEPRPKPVASISVVTGLSLLLLYVLSIGPAHGLALRGYLDASEGGVAQTLYSPLVRLLDVPGIGGVIQWYMDLWR